MIELGKTYQTREPTRLRVSEGRHWTPTQWLANGVVMVIGAAGLWLAFLETQG